MELSFEWVVFLKIVDNRPLKTYEELKMFHKLFHKHYWEIKPNTK